MVENISNSLRSSQSNEALESSEVINKEKVDIINSVMQKLSKVLGIEDFSGLEDVKKSFDEETYESVVDTVGKYEGEMLKSLIRVVGFLVRYNSEDLKYIVEKLGEEKFLNIIQNTEEMNGTVVIENVGFIGRRNPQILDRVIDIMGGYEGESLRHIFRSLAVIGVKFSGNMEKLIDTIEKYEGKLGKIVAEELESITIDFPDKLDDAIDRLGSEEVSNKIQESYNSAREVIRKELKDI